MHVYIFTWYFLQYQQLERKVCRGRIFNSKAVYDVCEGQSGSVLSLEHLTEYYNELVIQLRLAEYNHNESIEMEVTENFTKAALDDEEAIIKILNESILPALEFMVSWLETMSSHTWFVYAQLYSQ